MSGETLDESRDGTIGIFPLWTESELDSFSQRGGQQFDPAQLHQNTYYLFVPAWAALTLSRAGLLADGRAPKVRHTMPAAG